MHASIGYYDSAGGELTDEIKELAKKLSDLLPYFGHCRNASWIKGMELSVSVRRKIEEYCSQQCHKRQWYNQKTACK